MIVSSTSGNIESWDIPGALSAFPGLSIVPTNSNILTLSGWLDFNAMKPDHDAVIDSFELKIEISIDHPHTIPLVTPLGNRIPKNFHRMQCGALCLGSPTRQKLVVQHAPKLRSFIEKCVIPYLYAFVLHEQGKPLPFGELKHGRRGIIDDFMDIYGVGSEEVAKELLRLTGRPRRKANHQNCPCGSEKRLGRCHNRIVNELRSALGRLWFREQYTTISGGIRKDIER
jgi:hypothetical protein